MAISYDASFELCKRVLTFDFAYEILKCGNSNRSYLLVLSWSYSQYIYREQNPMRRSFILDKKCLQECASYCIKPQNNPSSGQGALSIMLMVALPFESIDEIVNCDHLKESYREEIFCVDVFKL